MAQLCRCGRSQGSGSGRPGFCISSSCVFFVIFILLNYLFPGRPEKELRSLRDRKPLVALAWPPVRVRSTRPSSARSPVSTLSPHQAAGRSKDQHHLLGHLRTHRAESFRTNLKLASAQQPASRSQDCRRHLPPVLPSRQLTCKTSGHSERPELVLRLHWLLPDPTPEWLADEPGLGRKYRTPHRRHSVACGACCVAVGSWWRTARCSCVHFGLP